MSGCSIEPQRQVQRTLSFFDIDALGLMTYFLGCKVDCRDKHGCAQQWRCERWVALNPSRAPNVSRIPEITDAVIRKVTRGEPYSPEVKKYVLSQYKEAETEVERHV